MSDEVRLLVIGTRHPYDGTDDPYDGTCGRASPRARWVSL